MLTLILVIALVAIFMVFVWSYPSHYAPNWRDFLVAFATSLGFMVFFYSMFPRYSLGRTGLVILVSTTVYAFWASLLALAWVQKLSKAASRKKVRARKPFDIYSIPDTARQDLLLFR